MLLAVCRDPGAPSRQAGQHVSEWRSWMNVGLPWKAKLSCIGVTAMPPSGLIPVNEAAENGRSSNERSFIGRLWTGAGSKTPARAVAPTPGSSRARGLSITDPNAIL